MRRSARAHVTLVAALATSCSTRGTPDGDSAPPLGSVCSPVLKHADDSRLDTGPFPRSLFLSAMACPDCIVLNIAPLHLPLTGVAAATAKVRMPDGTHRLITLDPSNKLVDAATLTSAERDAYAKKFGKYSPELQVWLDSATGTDERWVAVWTPATPSSIPKTELPKGSSAEAAAVKAMSANLELTLSPVRSWLAKFYPKAPRGDSSGPMLRARLPAAGIRELAKVVGVAQITTDGYPGKPSSPPWSSYSQWGESIRVQDLHVMTNGAGGKVCVKEQYRHDDPFALLDVAATADPTGATHWHTRMSAGIIRNRDAATSPWRSIAPQAEIYVANWNTYAGSIDQWCIDRGTRTLNYGHFLSTSPGGLTATDRANDWLARNYPYMLVSATTGYVDYTWDTVGNRGYNGLVVGGLDDWNTRDPSDDVPDGSSAWRNPIVSYYDDYELPHMVAPSNGVFVAGSEFGGGPSAATAMVSGVSTALDAVDSWFASWPEAKRAVIIATATGVTSEGILTKLPPPGGDRKTGAGALNAAQAALLGQPRYRSGAGVTAELGYYASAVWFNSSNFDATDYLLDKWKTKALKSGRLRVVLVWDASASCASGTCTTDTPDADLDLHLFRKTGDSSWTTTTIPDCYSTSYASTWEICDIPVDAGDEYMIGVRKYGANSAWTYLSVAWFHYQLPSGAGCSTDGECSSATCSGGRCTCASDLDCPDRHCSVGGQCTAQAACGAVGQPCCGSAVVAQPACDPGALCSAGVCTDCPTCPASSVQVFPTKPSFKQSESVSFRIFVPNNQSTGCSLPSNAFGVFTVESLQRDGVPVTPAVTSSSLVNGFFSARDASLVATGGKRWRTFTWGSERYDWLTPPNAITATTSDGLSGGDKARFDVGAVGSYVARLRYSYLPLPPVGLCPVPTQTTTVSFSVVGG